MKHVAPWIRRFAKSDEAATMPEYALMIALIAVVCIAAVTAIGTQANIKFTSVSGALGG